MPLCTGAVVGVGVTVALEAGRLWPGLGEGVAVRVAVRVQVGVPVAALAKGVQVGEPMMPGTPPQ